VNVKMKLYHEPNWYAADWCFEFVDSSLTCRMWDDMVDPNLFWDTLINTLNRKIANEISEG